MTLKQLNLVKCYEHTNLIIENIFLSSLVSLRNGFVLGTNILISNLWKNPGYNSLFCFKVSDEKMYKLFFLLVTESWKNKYLINAYYMNLHRKFRTKALIIKNQFYLNICNDILSFFWLWMHIGIVLN